MKAPVGQKEKDMLHRIINSIRHINHSSGFNGYLMRVQRPAGGPTVEEARKDYRKLLRTENPSMW